MDLLKLNSSVYISISGHKPGNELKLSYLSWSYKLTWSKNCTWHTRVTAPEPAGLCKPEHHECVRKWNKRYQVILTQDFSVGHGTNCAAAKFTPRCVYIKPFQIRMALLEKYTVHAHTKELVIELSVYVTCMNKITWERHTKITFVAHKWLL